MGKHDLKPVEARFSTELSIPRRYEVDHKAELELFALLHKGSQLVNGCFGFELRHPNHVTVEVDPTIDLLHRVLGAEWNSREFSGSVLRPLGPFEILEAVSRTHIPRFDLHSIRQGTHVLTPETAAEERKFADWFAHYKLLDAQSPWGKPLLELRGRAASTLNRKDPGAVTPGQFKGLVGARVYEEMKKAGIITF